MGRHSEYNDEIGKEICDTIATSSKGIKALCKLHPHWPCPDTIFRWRKEMLNFSDLYARAKQMQVEVFVDEIIEIADDSSKDYTVNDQGKTVVDHEHIQRSRVRIDTRKWIAGKLAPRIYGDKIEIKSDPNNTDIRDTQKIVVKKKLEHDERFATVDAAQTVEE